MNKELDFYTVEEAATILRVSKNTMYEEIRAEKINVVRVGQRRIIVPAKAILDYVGRNGNGDQS